MLVEVGLPAVLALLAPVSFLLVRASSAYGWSGVAQQQRVGVAAARAVGAGTGLLVPRSNRGHGATAVRLLAAPARPRRSKIDDDRAFAILVKASQNTNPKPWRGLGHDRRGTSVDSRRRRRNVMASIAEQTIEQLGGHGSVLARQRRDHIELDGLLGRLQQTAGDEQDEVLTRIWRLVFRHAYAEEAVLWPVIRAVLPDGDGLTLQIEREHQEINELAAALDRLGAPAADRDELISRLILLLRQDVRDEEDVLLPRLQEELDRGRPRRLGLTWEIVRRTAPTRPHPRVSRRPPGNVLAAVPLSLLDHSRGGLDRAARAGSGRVRTGATALSRGLAGVAGAVERLAPMRHGEHADTGAGRTAVETR